MQLFRIKNTDKFGNVLATDSKGMKVFEVKGGGIEVVKAENIEEVFPFTFAVSFNLSKGYDKEYHFLGEEGKFNVDDLLVYLGADHGSLGLCVVTKLDTKNRSATKTFSGYKLESTKLQ